MAGIPNSLAAVVPGSGPSSVRFDVARQVVLFLFMRPSVSCGGDRPLIPLNGPKKGLIDPTGSQPDDETCIGSTPWVREET
ncbi:MAG: hypothetical protein KIT00_06105, partial [Rhodospirillales bacterium]|nr:hypothetical protein [Rhodospirillales bacterium]